MTTGSGRSDFEWPGIAMCAMLIGLVIAFSFSGSPAIAGAAGQLRQLFAWRDRPVALEARLALIVTANPRDQLTVIATLSPRGFDPLLASCGREVLAQIRAHPGTLSLAVVDATLPDYALIERALKGALPTGSIIVMQGSHRSKDIGPMLLDRLRFVDLNPRGTHGSPWSLPNQLRPAPILTADTQF